jgi:hypothetical protein
VTPAAPPATPLLSPRPTAAAANGGALKDAFLAEVRSGKSFFYNTVVAQAQRIDVSPEAITFVFLPTHKALRQQCEDTRAWLEGAAERVVGRRMSVTAVLAAAASGAGPAAETAPAPSSSASSRDLRAEALSSTPVQAMLEVFPAEIRDVEEI